MGINVDTVRTGDSEDSRGGSNMIPVLSGNQESRHHISSQRRLERRKKEGGRQHVSTLLIMVTSKDKCWNTLTKTLLFFTKSCFLLPTFLRCHRGLFWKGIPSRSCHKWRARAMDLNFIVTLTSSTGARSGLCSSAQEHGQLASHSQLPGRHCVRKDISTTGHTTCWDPSLPKTVLWVFQSTVLICTCPQEHLLWLKNFPLTLRALSVTSVVKKLPALSAVTLRLIVHEDSPKQHKYFLLLPCD